MPYRLPSGDDTSPASGKVPTLVRRPIFSGEIAPGPAGILKQNTRPVTAPAPPDSATTPYIRAVQVPQGFDVADSHIVEQAAAGAYRVVITAHNSRTGNTGVAAREVRVGG